VLFAEAAQNAMATNYTSITEGAILVGTVIFWSYSLTGSPTIVHPFSASLTLHFATRAEWPFAPPQHATGVDEDELMSQLRQQAWNLLLR